MKSVLMRHTSVSFISRCTALICAVTWFVASNHCALAAMIDGFAKRGAPVAMQCEHCPTKDQSGGSSRTPLSGCCKGIKATVPSGTMAHFGCAISASMLAVVVAFVDVPRPTFAADFDDTGPPRTWAFAATILSRSFQSHAPPIFG